MKQQSVRACSIIIGLAASSVALAAPQAGLGDSYVSPVGLNGSKSADLGPTGVRVVGGDASSPFSVLGRGGAGLPSLTQTPPVNNAGSDSLPDFGSLEGDLSPPDLGTLPPGGSPQNAPPAAPAPLAALGGGAILAARLMGRRR